MTFFPGWQAQMEAGMTAIEGMWGEQADLLPWQKSGATRFVEPGPDTTRPVVSNVRILFKRKPVMTVAEGESKVAGEQTYAVIRTEYIDQCGLTQGDRIRLRDRGNELFVVTYLGQKYTTRQRVYLTEEQEPPV